MANVSPDEASHRRPPMISCSAIPALPPATGPGIIRPHHRPDRRWDTHQRRSHGTSRREGGAHHRRRWRHRRCGGPDVRRRGRERGRRRPRRGRSRSSTRIATAGGRALAVAADVTDRTSIDDAVAATVEAFGGLDVLYNNAGVSLAGDGGPTDTDDATWDTTHGGERQGRVAGLPGRDPGDARVGWRVDHQRRVVRGATSAPPPPNWRTRRPRERCWP